MPNYRIRYEPANAVLENGEFDNDRDAIRWANDTLELHPLRVVRCILEKRVVDDAWTFAAMVGRVYGQTVTWEEMMTLLAAYNPAL